MRLKSGVNAVSIADEVWFALGVADTLRKSLIVTSLRDGKHKTDSLHYSGRAADVRTHDLDEQAKDRFFVDLSLRLEPLGFDLVFEDRGGLNEHIHIEFDPKPGELFLRREPA